ncbi:MAG TPA: sulfur oxidation c-type cytochrome SoxX [Usitatibacter sp.]|jgi:L-cysteine S-thiosulfotransferase|nr:sulfur oxidation c-type cytochrome SoxX [Usitatibacter sp.]
MNRWPPLLVCLLMGCASSPPPERADALETPLAASGDPGRGREVFLTRDEGRCVLCHAAPGVELAGNVGPSLAGVGSRLTPAQMRLRIADITRVYPDSVMPTFHRTEGMVRVAPQFRDKPALTGQQVEDLVAWLSTLK